MYGVREPIQLAVLEESLSRIRTLYCGWQIGYGWIWWIENEQGMKVRPLWGNIRCRKAQRREAMQEACRLAAYCLKKDVKARQEAMAEAEHAVVVAERLVVAALRAQREVLGPLVALANAMDNDND